MKTDSSLIIIYDKPILGVTGTILGLKINGSPATFTVINKSDNIIDRINEELFHHSIIFIPGSENVINEIEDQNYIKAIYVIEDNENLVFNYHNILKYDIEGPLTNSKLLDIYKMKYKNELISDYTMRRNYNV